MMVYILILILFAVGLYGILSQKNLVKVIISLAIMEHALNVFLVVLGYRTGGTMPIRTLDMSRKAFAASAVDPLPQAMVLTAIVIGLGITVLLVAIALRVYQRYGTYDVSEIRKLRG